MIAVYLYLQIMKMFQHRQYLLGDYIQNIFEENMKMYNISKFT
jgi:hypothetical protein